MRGPRATPLQVSASQAVLLRHISQRQTACQRQVRRAAVLLALASNPCVEAVAQQVRLSRVTVRLWRDRWNSASAALLHAEKNATPKQFLALVEDTLDDEDRSGAPSTFTPEQIVQIIAIACEPPEKSDRPISHWTTRELADEVKKRQIVSHIHPTTVGLFLKRGRFATAS
jgi:putative transposase